MRKNCVVMLCLLCAAVLGAQVYTWQWARAGGSPADDLGLGVATDNEGNVYVTGSCSSGAVFGNLELNDNPGTDAFVVKYSSLGCEQWAIRFGGSSLDRAYTICCDDEGYVYVAGQFTGTAHFGLNVLTATGVFDTFLACLDADGNWQWVIQGGGAGSSTMVTNRLIIGDDGFLYACGQFSGTVYLGNKSLSSSGQDEIWAAKFNLLGGCMWASSAGGSQSDLANSIAYLPSGELVVCGRVRANANFGSHPSPGASVNNGFLAWLSAEGEWEFALRLTSTVMAECNDLDVDSQGSIYVTGDFGTAMQCGFVQVTGDARDTFIGKIESSGRNFAWLNVASAYGSTHGAAIAISPDDRIWWVGYFLDSIQLGDYVLECVVSPDIFLAKVSGSGEYELAIHAGNICDDLPQDMIIDGGGNVILSGYYSGDMYFGDNYLPMCGCYQVFTAKMNEPVALLEEPTAPPLAVIGNQPNPFRNSTAVTYSLKRACASAQLRVYDLRGRLVKNLGNIAASPGSHSVNWDGRDREGKRAAAGIYLIRLSLDGQTQQRRIVLLD